MLSLDDAMIYLGIDYPDERVTHNVESALKAAQSTLLGAVGSDLEKYLPDDPRAAELVRIYLDDLYSERGVSAKVSGATRSLVTTMEWQLRLDLRKAREEAGAV